MKNLRTRFERFCYRNQNKGISNLMLYIVIGNAIVYIMSMLDKSNTLYYVLCFDRASILQGQIWRLFTYAFTFNAGNILLTAVGLLCYFSLGRAMENAWGTLRFNLFYLTGIILMDIFALIFGGNASIYYLNLSLFLGYATLYPNSQFLLLFIIPVRAWIFALLDLVLTFIDVITGIPYFPLNLFPLIAIANYFLFFGKDVINIVPTSWQMKLGRTFKKKKATVKTGAIPFTPHVQKSAPKPTYTHRCTVCGRTDTTNPELEFRYCSRCKGYHCYCEDHIGNHTHIE